MKAIVLLLLVFGLVSSKQEDIVNHIIQGLKGFFEGFTEGKELSITKCVNDGAGAVSALKEAIKHWKEINWDDLDRILDFLIDVSEFGESFFGAFESCAKILSELWEILGHIRELKGKQVLERIKRDIFLIINWLNDAIRNAIDKKFDIVGKNLGKIANLIVYDRDIPK